MQRSEPFHSIQKALPIIQTSITSKCFKADCLYLQFYKKILQCITITKINLFESNKNFSSAVSIRNKLLVDMHKFLDKYLS